MLELYAKTPQCESLLIVANAMHDGLKANNRVRSVDDFLTYTSQVTSEIESDHKRIFFFVEDAESLANCLIRLVDIPCEATAIKSDHHGGNRSLVLVSPPKAGSHFVISIVEAFGFGHGGQLPMNPKPGHWYSLDHPSIHTSCASYFMKKNNEGDFYGGRLRGFDNCSGIVCYRHPRDIVRSRLNYNFDPRNTIMGRYMHDATRRQKAESLLDPDSIFGDLGRELVDYANWLEFPNMIPVSFEELRGTGADDDGGWRAIWDLQLHLQIGGNPEQYWRQAFGNSDTFRSGAVLRSDPDVDPLADRITDLCSAYMARLGYSPADPSPTRPKEIRRTVRLPEDFRPKDIPITVLDTSLFNIYFLNGQFYAVSRYGETPRFELVSDEVDDLIAEVLSIENEIKFKKQKLENALVARSRSAG